MDENIYDVAKEISDQMGNLIGVRVYIMISDSNGNVLFSDTMLEKHKNLITPFIKSNFNYLKIGEHSIPLSSENIVFFRTSDKSLTVLHNPKGRVGQLLRFKSIMKDYCDTLEQCFENFIPVEPATPEPVPVIVEIPMKEVKLPIISKKESKYSRIKGILNRKIDEKERFSIDEGRILRLFNDRASMLDLLKFEDLPQLQLFEILSKFYDKKVIQFDHFTFIRTHCPECKNWVYLFIPDYLLEKVKEKIRVQLFPEECAHTFLAFIDKKLNIKTKKIEKLLEPMDKLELLKLNIENLIAFFGQDLFFNIFHAIFFRIPILFVGESIEEHIVKITGFLKRFFPNLEYNEHILCVDEIEYKKNYKNYQNFLVIDYYSHFSIDPYKEKEYFDFELKLFKEVLSIEKTNLQVLKVNSEFETLILHTDRVLTEIEALKEISEDDLIKVMKNEHNLTIKHEEIPIIQKLAEIYYDTDVSRKIIRTVSGQLSSFFDII